MLVRRSTFLTATLIAAMLTLAFAGNAMADSGAGDTSSAPAPATTESKPPAETSTKPPVETKAPVTVVPAPPVTEVPKTTVTETPTTTAAVTCESTSPCGEKPGQPELPTESTCADTPTAADCIPDTPGERDRLPDAPGGGDTQLPFTGPGDVLLAVVLALLAGSGGILFMFGASSREQLDTLNRRGMDSPSGFHLAYRELRKDQLGR